MTVAAHAKENKVKYREKPQFGIVRKELHESFFIHTGRFFNSALFSRYPEYVIFRYGHFREE